MNAIWEIGWALAKINWRLGDFVLSLGKSPIRLYHDDGTEKDFTPKGLGWGEL